MTALSAEQRLTRRQKKLSHKGQVIEIRGLQLANVLPITDTQKRVFTYFNEDKNLFLTGSAGTGKTFCAFYLGLQAISEDYKRVIVFRSAEPSKSIGFLPGTAAEKTKVYEYPYYSICAELYGRGDAYDILKQKGMVEFYSTSFIRGLTFNNSIIIVDEAQNLEANELYAIMTRMGKNTKIIFCGDFAQSDIKNNHKDSDRKNDYLRFWNVIKAIPAFGTVQFMPHDIVRSDIVKDFIIEAEKQGFSS